MHVGRASLVRVPGMGRVIVTDMHAPRLQGTEPAIRHGSRSVLSGGMKWRDRVIVLVLGIPVVVAILFMVSMYR